MATLIIKICITVFLIILIPVYWVTYGWENFLWFSDVGLFLTFFAFWFNSPLIISMLCIGILPFEIFWTIDFFIGLKFGESYTILTDYMFNPKYSYFVTGLSLFHIVLPVIWISYLFKWGYDKRAFIYQLILTEIVLLLTFFLTEPATNINLVFAATKYNWQWLPDWGWLLVMMIGLPVAIIFPLHKLYSALIPRAVVK